MGASSCSCNRETKSPRPWSVGKPHKKARRWAGLRVRRGERGARRLTGFAQVITDKAYDQVNQMFGLRCQVPVTR